MKTKILTRNELTSKVCVVVGTRPSIMKMGPIIKELQRRRIDFFVVHAGQHYSYNMDKKFFEELELPEPRYRIDCVRHCRLHGEQTAEMIKGIEKILIREKPRVVLVCADANFNLAGALVARKLGLKLGHVEAGLRSGDWQMPEEHNRVIIDHISDYLFVPTDEARKNAIKDNVKGDVILTGNTIVDAIEENIKIAVKKSNILQDLGLEKGGYFLVTVHREENVDLKEKLSEILNTLNEIGEKFNRKIIFPMHPRTSKMIKNFGFDERIGNIKNLDVLSPVGYMDFLVLLSGAYMTITDSGGIQEESCILKIPCVTLRDNTERPETVLVNSNIIAGVKSDEVVAAIEKNSEIKRDWRNPFGDGKASKKIVDRVVVDL